MAAVRSDGRGADRRHRSTAWTPGSPTHTYFCHNLRGPLLARVRPPGTGVPVRASADSADGKVPRTRLEALNPVSFLIRVQIPDRPGSLGAVATALGKIGADILSVDVVERDSE